MVSGDADEDGEDEDLLPELDYEKDDPDRDFGIIEGDDEYDEDDAFTEAEGADADESDDPSQYDRYMSAEQEKANGKEAPTTIKSHQAPDEKRLLKKRLPRVLNRRLHFVMPPKQLSNLPERRLNSLTRKIHTRWRPRLQ